MKPVTQEEISGCGIASVAALSGLSYQEAKTVANSLGIQTTHLHPMTTDAVELGEPFLSSLHRHVINLMCVDRGTEAMAQHGGKPAVYNFSAFIVEVSERWFAISAGHIFRQLKLAVDAGAKLSDWQIDDSIISSKPKDGYPIALNIEKDVLYLSDEPAGIDYAYIEITYLARQALSKEGICAIPENIWSAEDIADFTLWLLVGTPLQFAKLEIGKPIVKNHATIQLDRVADIPEGLDTTEFQRLYAKINFESVQDPGSPFDIGGMSGGPIFGLLPSTSSVPYQYRLIGVQSAWNKKEHVAICAAYPFIKAISFRVAHA